MFLPVTFTATFEPIVLLHSMIGYWHHHHRVNPVLYRSASVNPWDRKQWFDVHGGCPGWVGLGSWLHTVSQLD